MSFTKEFWLMLNGMFDGNPTMLFLSLGLLLVVGNILKSIPHLIKWWRGELQKERDEKIKTRENILASNKKIDGLTTVIAAQTRELKIMNGSVKKHHARQDIHTPVGDLMTEKLCQVMHGNLKEDISKISKHLGIPT